MPDEWEARYTNTDANRPDANEDADGDGYPNIEEYLNMLAKDDVRYENLFNSSRQLPAPNCGR